MYKLPNARKSKTRVDSKRSRSRIQIEMAIDSQDEMDTMRAQVAVLTEALQVEGLPLPELLELKFQRDPRRGKAKVTRLDQEKSVGPNPSKLILGGNDRVRANDDLCSHPSSPNGKHLRKVLNHKYSVKKAERSTRSESINNEEWQLQFE